MADGGRVTATREVGTLRYGRAIRRRWPLIVLFTVLGVIAGVVTAKPPAVANPLKTPATLTTNQYSATALLMLVSGGSATTSDPSGLSLSAMAYFATTGQVPRMVAQQLGYGGNPADLARQVSVTPNTTIGVLQVSATEPAGPEAVRLVNAFDQQLINYLNNQIKQSYARQQAAAQAQLQAVRARIAELQQQGGSPLAKAEITALQSQYNTDVTQYAQLQGLPPKTDLTVIQPPAAVPGAAPVAGASGAVGSTGTASAAAAPTTTTSHSKIPQGKLGRGLLGGAVGFLVGLALALLLDRFDTRLYTTAELEAAFGLPLLADLRAGGGEEPVVAVSPLSEAAERYRMLQASLAAEWTSQRGAQVILVAPVHVVSGGSAVAANLAIAFRDAGHAVAVVTGEPLGRRQSVLGREGWAQRQEAPQGGVAVTEDLQVLVADGRSPGARTSEMLDLVEAAKATVDVVVIDAAPLLVAHDATRLASQSGAIVLVAAAGRERVAEARRATSLLRLIDGAAAGLVVLKLGGKVAKAKPGRPRSQGRHSRSGSRGAGKAPTPSTGLAAVDARSVREVGAASGRFTVAESPDFTNGNGNGSNGVHSNGSEEPSEADPHPVEEWEGHGP